MLDFLNFSWIDILDILMVALIIFLIFRWIRGSTAINIFIAIIIVLLVRVVAEAVGMKMISSLLGTVIDMGAVALVVIFQPEIRRFLSSLGRKAETTLQRPGFLQWLFPSWQSGQVDVKALREITEAVREMAAQKEGALILILHKNSLDDIVATGDVVDAEISRRLIMNIFFKNSPCTTARWSSRTTASPRPGAPFRSRSALTCRPATACATRPPSAFPSSATPM